VSFNNTLSDTVLPVISGVQQGIILGSLLFLVYMNSISSTTQASQVLRFTDDMKLFMSTSSPDDRNKLQQDIDSITHQISVSHLAVNFTKFIHIPFKSTSNTRYFISKMEITYQKIQKDLGLIVFSGHPIPILYIISKAYKLLALLLLQTLPISQAIYIICVYTTLVRPHLTYCSQIW